MTIPEIPERLETERLIIRSPRLEDISAIYTSVRESLAELSPWMAWATPEYSLAGCEENTRSAIAEFITRQNLRYHFHDRDTDEHIGCSGLHRIDWNVPKFEIGYWCRTSRTGQGYVTETVEALTNLALEDFGAARVEIQCDDKNVRSAGVAERCGYGLEGVLKNHSRGVDGSLRDTRIYAVTQNIQRREKGRTSSAPLSN